MNLKNKIKILGGFLVLFGFLVLLLNKIQITGAVIGINNNFSYPTFTILLFFGILIILFSTTLEEHILSKVHGKNPISGKESTSNLYRRVNEHTIHKIFQTPLHHKYKKPIMGAKAIGYRGYEGKYRVAFLSEAIDTHHRHAASTVAKLIDGKSPNEEFDKKTEALYEGHGDRACELLEQCVGFELQYDPSINKIIGIQQDSWITKEQARCNRRLPQEKQESMFLELLTSIDPAYSTDKIQKLEKEFIEDLYAK